MEDKQQICDLLLAALQATENMKDLTGLSYSKETQVVTATFADGHTKKAVAMGSGAALIRAVVGQIL